MQPSQEHQTRTDSLVNEGVERMQDVVASAFDMSVDQFRATDYPFDNVVARTTLEHSVKLALTFSSLAVEILDVNPEQLLGLEPMEIAQAILDRFTNASRHADHFAALSAELHAQVFGDPVHTDENGEVDFEAWNLARVIEGKTQWPNEIFQEILDAFQGRTEAAA